MASGLKNKSIKARLTGSVPADMPGLSQMLDSARQFSSSAGLEGDDKFQFLIVVEELVTNIVTHGMSVQGSTIDYEFAAENGAVHVIMADSGVPFDPRALMHPAIDPEPQLDQEGGWGWPLIFRWCDLDDYRRAEGRNVLTLTLKG